MLLDYKRGQGSIILRVKILDSSVSTGAGKTGLSSASSGLVISTIADNEASPTSYTVAGSTIEAVATLGTYAAPTATKCRFAEVSSTYHPGVYELHIADARFAVSSAKSLLISISGATNAAQCDAVIPLRDVDPYDAAAFGMSRLDAAVSTRSTLTQSEVTGGAYALNHASFAFNAALDFTTTQKAATLARVTTVDQLTNNNDKSGYSLLGTPDVNVASIAGAPVAVDTGTAGTVSFVSGAYVATAGATVNANVTQWQGENVQSQTDGIPLVSVVRVYDSVLDSYEYPPTATAQNATYTATQSLLANDTIMGAQLTSIGAKTTNLPAAPAAVSDCITAAGVRSAIGLASANLDAQLAALTAATITFTGPVNPITGEVTLIRGDDYFADDGRGLSYTVPYSGGNPDLTGATVTAAWHAGSTIATTVTAVVSGAGGPSQAVAIEIPRAKTALLTQSHYTLVLSAVLADGHVFTFMRQSCLVQPPRGS